MQKLNMVDADTLLYQPLDKPRFVVDGLIPTGLILFCGLCRRDCLSGKWRHGQAMCCTSVWRIPFSAYRTGFFV